MSTNYFKHESAYVDEGSSIGSGTKIWHFCHIMSEAIVGKDCILGQNVMIASGVRVGNNVKIQNNVAVYTGTEIEDDVFLGPSCVLTNIPNPRSQIVRRGLYEQTLIRRGATIGANATIVCGTTIGRYAFVAAAAVVTRSIPDYAMVMGCPARRVGWMSRHGHRLMQDHEGIMTCPESGYRYREIEPGVIRCMDLDEEVSLPATQHTGRMRFRDRLQ